MTTGFNKQFPDSANRKYTSWGRTRTPKNILSHHRAGTNADGDGLSLDGTSDPYITENQRFLTIQVKTWDTSFHVEGRMHAAAAGEFEDIKSSPTINGAGLWVVEFNGVDEVRFVTGGACVFWAGCSTF